MYLNHKFFLLLFCIPLYLLKLFLLHLETKAPISFTAVLLFSIYIVVATVLLVIKPLVPKHIAFFGAHLFFLLPVIMHNETLFFNKDDILFYLLFFVPSLIILAILIRQKDAKSQSVVSGKNQNEDIVQTLRFGLYAYLAVAIVFLLLYIFIYKIKPKIIFDYASFVFLILIASVSAINIIIKRKKDKDLAQMSRFCAIMLVLIIYYFLVFMLWANQLPRDLILLFFPWFLCIFVFMEQKPILK